MKRTVLFSLVTFLLGIGLAALVLANPFGWASIDRLRGRSAVPDGAAGTSDQAEGQPTERKIKYWRAPMDPTYIRDKPGKSPMGMDLVPVYEDEEEGPAPGMVRIDPAFVQNIGVQSEPVRRTDIPFTVRTVGMLAYDDGQAVWVNTKFDGWIERVYVNYVGEAVRKGQKLFEIYSPQLVTTQNEYLQAVDYAKRMAAADYPEAAKRASSLVESSRQRLTYWDISDAQIDELQDSRKIRRTLTAVSPADGLVVEKMSQALEGMSVKAGMNLYKIVDLSKIWAEAEIYEHQVPWLKVGQRAVVDVPTDPGRRIIGRVRYVYPFFSEKTRTMKVSIELPNPGNRLRADMYVNITFDVPSAQNVLVVPEEAVIHSGTRKVLVLDRGNGTFQVREVKLGVNGSGLWEVKDGVEDGDLVVVSAQFLIDSESSLKEAIRKLTTAGSGDSPPDTPDQSPVDHSQHPAPPTPKPAVPHNEHKS
jgi:Cu(I)/Ag(I) efflux system membrane fusion protein/cobalt-zinc-cadmium efflux system membrane fusion protein